LNPPDQLKLHQLYQLSLKNLQSKCPDFSSHAIVFLFQSLQDTKRDLDRALQEKAILAFEHDILQTRLKRIVDKSEKVVNNVETLLNNAREK